MTVAALCAAAAIVGWLIYSRSTRRAGEDEQLVALAGDGESPLLRQMIGLRGDLRAERTKHLRDRLVFLGVTVALLLLWNGQRNTTDRIVATRTQGRAATCAVFQAYTDALVASAAPQTQAQHDATQAKTDAFVSFLNSKLDVIKCELTSPQVRPAPEPGG